MIIRLRGLSAEVAEGVQRLQAAFTVVSVSQQYKDHGASRMVRVYVEVRL